jgi:DNA-binding GntR family transcriptional regulator
MRPAVDQVTTTSLADEIALRLQAAILDGEHPPGSHLLQDELCERFGVSRTPVREALRKLQAKHLVVLVPNKGATVRVPSRQELIDVYACALACTRVDDGVLAALDEAQSRVLEAVVRYEEVGGSGTDNLSLDLQVARANAEFHDVIARTAGNERLRSSIVELREFFPKDYVWRAMASADSFRALNQHEHEHIRDALARRRAPQARKEMRSHVMHAWEILSDYLDRQQFWQ